MSRRSQLHRALSTARGVLLAVSSAALSVTAHGLAGGGVPHPATTLLLTVLIGWVGTAAADRTRGTRGILLVLGCGQMATHLLLAELSGHPGEPPTMLAAHAVATVLTAMLLAHAESMLAVALAALRRLLPLALRLAPVPSAPALPTLALPAGATTVVEVVLRRMHGRRGPPALS
ncbi:hypothetical protein ACFS2C_26850 [Prauserella oleivorans]|uniref:MFS transporter n=1 Tax=Prauserella oleivorans TaxID=1478153 RepID=A0ABW5WIT8_9PSEU